MKYLLLVLLVLPMCVVAQDKPDSPYVDPFPRWVRDTLPKPIIWGRAKKLSSLMMMDTSYILVGPDSKTGCFEIWDLKSWRRLEKIWGAYNDAGHHDREWICTCNY
jgi:hypothetical protein